MSGVSSLSYPIHHNGRFPKWKTRIGKKGRNTTRDGLGKRSQGARSLLVRI